MRGGLTTEQLAAWRRPAWFVRDLLRDEQRRGHVRQINGRWCATESLLETYWAAFGCIVGPGPTTAKETSDESDS
jgi:hypothetical protein